MHRRADLRRAIGEYPTKPGLPFGGCAIVIDQRTQHLQAGLVGKVQVIDPQPAHADLRIEKAAEGALHDQALAFAGHARGHRIELRQHARDFAAGGRRQDSVQRLR